MSHISRSLLSQHLTPCPFCGDIHPEIHSGPCQYTKPEMFQAQVHCGHCGATGTRFCGEEDLGEAEIKAAQEWTRASTPKPGPRKHLSDANKWFFTIWLGMWIGNATMPINASTTVFAVMLGGSMILGIVLGIIEGRATYRREVAQWKRMRERIGAQTGT